MDTLIERAWRNGVRDLVRLDPEETREWLSRRWNASARSSRPRPASSTPTSTCSHSRGDAEANGAVVALGSPCLGGAVRDDGIRIDAGGAEPTSLLSDVVVVNAAALGAQDVARSIEGLDPAHVPPPSLREGELLLPDRPIRPSRISSIRCPRAHGSGCTSGLDLGRRCRFGPDLHWCRHPRLRRGHQPDRAFLCIDPALLPGVA